MIKKGKKTTHTPWETRRGPFLATPQLLSWLWLQKPPSASPGAQSCFAMGRAWCFGDGHMEKLSSSSFNSLHRVQSPKPAGASPPPGWPRVVPCDITLIIAPHFAASPPALGSLVWIWSPNATRTTITYSVTNSAPKPCTGSSADPTPLGETPKNRL